jgi:hypothetical protein
MATGNLPRHHVLSTMRASMLETEGFTNTAKKLRAQAKLRLCIMEPVELETLANLLAYLPRRTPHMTLIELLEARKEYLQDTSWLSDVWEKVPQGT